MLGAEDCGQLNTWNMRQHVCRAPAVCVDSGLIRDQADSDRMIRIGVELAKCVFLEHVDPRLYFTVAHSEAPLSHQRFVVSGDAGEPQLFVLVDFQIKRIDDGGSDVGAQRHHRSVAVGVHRIGENDDVRVCDRIDPKRGACKAGVPE